MIRCFVCVEVMNQHNISEISSILEYISEFNGIRPVKLNQLHLTLKFLGDVSEEKIPLITQELKQITQEKITLDFSHLGFFPNDRRPRVMWIGLSEGKQQLSLLAKEIDNRLSTLGFPREKRKFSPHLTLGRLKNYGKYKLKTEDIKKITHYANNFGDFNGEVEDVGFFLLKKSTLTPQGAIYENLFEFVFKE